MVHRLSESLDLLENIGHREELIMECRAFSVAELQRMIATNEIRDANTLSLCARLAARGFLAFTSPSL